MDKNKNEKIFTEQGLGSPVPVGVGSGRTGSPRPSSLDCHAPMVDHQARELVTDTGHWLEKLGKSRNKKSLMMELGEACKRGSVSAPTSPNIGSIDLTWDEVTGRSTKRKRAGEVQDKEQTLIDGEERIAAAVRGLVRAMDKEVRHLALLVQENSNTKKEIKEVSAMLRSMSSRLMSRQMQEALNSMGYRRCEEGPDAPVEDKAIMVELPVNDMACQTLGSQIEEEGKTGKVDVGTQTLDEQEEITSAEIIRELRECSSDESFLELVGKPWPESLYEHSVVSHGDPMEGDKDLALYVPGGEMYNGTLAQAAVRFPELKDMGKECQRDYTGSLLRVTSTRDGESVARKETIVYKMVPATVDGRDSVLEILQMTRRLGEHMDLDRRNRVALLFPPEIPLEAGRKAIEYALRNTNKLIELYDLAPRRSGAGGPPAEATVVVRVGDKSFVEALKEVKEGLSDTEGVKLQAVKKTQQGDILLVVKGGMNGAMELEEKIRNRTGMAAYARDGGRKTLFIQGIDGVTSKEEILVSVQNHLKCEDQRGFSVASLRPTRRDNQTATLLATKDIAERLIADGRIYIGCLECRIKERIDLPKCFKCLEYGHTRAYCKGPSREDTCFKCGKPGHVAKDCTGQGDFCHACQREGHRSSSTNCPIFRKMISEARDRARLGRGNRSRKVGNR